MTSLAFLFRLKRNENGDNMFRLCVEKAITFPVENIFVVDPKTFL